ncbi:MAG: uroporphyrinogen-III C-methyltransferase [Rhodospirillaceae bacterium]|nr:uroporphyrinogen-III C-methyltransferase [Rhodospirillaceae bacterium]OUT79098.1 MAG: uroporphyrinogen-III C-methyltransferase [Rhodospirillaceae bacterium TMED23]|tara:strand:+ start:6794 stop:7567 length:774 start_codon:yes stop_codon:yes gene_type:complete
METLLKNPPEFELGSVWITGAGPGDPGLLSLLGLHGIQTADVIVYDALVSEDILSFAGTSVILEFAGKRGGRPSPKQRDITDRLVELAKQNKRVLRLKGGDPFMFGRGTEECLRLASEKIPYRIIPGISSGVGGLAYAGIPMTTRGTNSAVTFVTGHNASGNVPEDIDWKALSDGSPALIFFMGISHIDRIVEKLKASGRPPSEPVAVIYKATMRDQRVVITTLDNCSKDILSAGLRPPALIVVGEIVNLRNKLDWF